MLELQLKENVKARILDSKMRNTFRVDAENVEAIRSQEKLFSLVKG